MKITESQLRRIIREAVQGTLRPGQLLDTAEMIEMLVPGDNIIVNDVPKTVVGVDPLTTSLSYVGRGRAIKKVIDYGLAIKDPDDPPDTIPEIQITYDGPGTPPKRTRLPPRKKGPGYSYSIYD